MKVQLIVIALVGCGGPQPKVHEDMPPVAANELRPVAAFAGIADRGARSRALFGEMAKVIAHPRCRNCHPDGDSPHQRALEAHEPPVVRGPEDNGVPGLECTTCHQDRNQAMTRVPGAPKWHLAPRAMAWVGKSMAAICAQMKDPGRNGGRTLAQLVEHSGHDELVGWAWAPGADREPAPGTQAQFGALAAAWVETGAACPEENR